MTSEELLPIQRNTWDVPKKSGRVGTGNWKAFNLGLEPIYEAAKDWKTQVKGAERLWLCWNLDDSWCVLQQKLLISMGWTPVIGWDPNCSPDRRTVLSKSIEIDFNAQFGFATIWPHFPLEFAFLWTDRLAFWHSDLLVRKEKLYKIMKLFDSLQDGEMAAVKSYGGLRNIFKFKQHRYWELIGCTTQGASRHQFDAGCGWWRSFCDHPNTPEAERDLLSAYCYEHGVGVMYWKRRYGKKIYNISERWVKEGHCSRIGAKNYITGDNKAEELRLNYDLNEVARRLNLDDLI